MVGFTPLGIGTGHPKVKVTRVATFGWRLPTDHPIVLSQVPGAILGTEPTEEQSSPEEQTHSDGTYRTNPEELPRCNKSVKQKKRRGGGPRGLTTENGLLHQISREALI